MFGPSVKLAADELRRRARVQRHARIVLRVEDYHILHKDGIPEEELVAKVAVKEGVRMQLAQDDVGLLVAAGKLSASGTRPARFIFPAPTPEKPEAAAVPTGQENLPTDKAATQGGDA